MKIKILKALLFVLSFITLTVIFTNSAFALTWDGSSNGGTGGGSTAGPNGYAIRTTSDNCLGYRFSVVDKYGNNKVSKVIDIFRNTTYGNSEYSSAHKFTTKYNKKQIINNQNNSFNTASTTSNCYKETSMGFASGLPTPEGMGTWQNNQNNLNPVLNTLGIAGIGSLVNGDKVLVEPLFDVRLQSVYHSVTVTELAIYGKWLLGANSNGGSSGNSESWGFISGYTNKIYPNALFTPDGQGLWTAAGTLGSRATFYTIINNGYGAGIAYTETKPDFSPTLSVNICEAWRGSKSNRSFHYGNSTGSAFGNFTYANGYPVLGDSVWFAVNFPAESQAVRVRQYIRHGGNWLTRDVDLNSANSSSMWFDAIFTGNEGGGSQPTTLIETGRVFYMVDAKQDWLDGSGNILKSGAVKSFYIPIKPKINRYQVTMYDLTNTMVAKNGTAGLSGAVYVGQRVYPKYTYTSENTWTSSNYLRGAIYSWTNNAWNTTYPLNGGSDLYVDNQGINSTSRFERYSDFGLYKVPDNSANTNGSNRIPFKLWTHWVSDWQNTTESTWIDIPIIKADLELKEIRLIDESNFYVTASSLYPLQKVIPQYVYKNNTNAAIYIEGYDSDRARISGIYVIAPNSEIYVNGKQITIPNQTSYSFWGGVYLESAGIYNTAWETNGTNNAKTLSMTVTPPLKIEPVIPNAPYRENTQVITSFKVINSAPINFYPTSNVSVKFTAKSGSTILYSETKNNIVIPSSGDNLVYFKWTVPIGLNQGNVTLLGELIQNVVSVDSKVFNHPSALNINSIPPNTRFEKARPSDFVKLSPPINSNMLTSTWSEWVYEGNTFVRKPYSVVLNATSPTLVPDVNSPSRVFKDGLWTMKSGYGYTVNWSVSWGLLPTTNTPLSNAYTGAQTANLYLPEFKFETSINKYRSLGLSSLNSFELPTNPYALNNAKLHFVPLWFPDGQYIAQGYVSDFWTPAGMLYGYANSTPINISQSAYDDWYIG